MCRFDRKWPLVISETRITGVAVQEPASMKQSLESRLLRYFESQPGARWYDPTGTLTRTESTVALRPGLASLPRRWGHVPVDHDHDASGGAATRSNLSLILPSILGDTRRLSVAIIDAVDSEFAEARCVTGVTLPLPVYPQPKAATLSAACMRPRCARPLF